MVQASPVGTFELTESARILLCRRAFQSAPMEACGFIMSDGSVVEIRNISLHPHNSFEMDRHQLAEKGVDPKDVAALWHTHPSGSVFPSPTDQHNMAALGEGYGNWAYLIITKDEVAQYNTATQWSGFA